MPISIKILLKMIKKWKEWEETLEKFLINKNNIYDIKYCYIYIYHLFDSMKIEKSKFY